MGEPFWGPILGNYFRCPSRGTNFGGHSRYLLWAPVSGPIFKDLFLGPIEGDTFLESIKVTNFGGAFNGPFRGCILGDHFRNPF